MKTKPILSMFGICFLLSFQCFVQTAHASDGTKMPACLPDKLGEFNAIDSVVSENLESNITTASRQYKKDDKIVKITVWKLPGDKEIWPFIGSKGKASMLIVAGRLCVLNKIKDNNTATLIIRLDTASVSTPQFHFRVTAEMKGSEDTDTITSIGEKLDYDKLFRLR